MRKALYPIISKIRTYDIASFDIETYGKDNKFLLGGIYDNQYRFFNTKECLVKELNKHKLIVATNLQFDFNSLFNENKDFLQYHIIQKHGNYILIIKEKQRFFDTLNISPSSVESLGKLLGIPKLNHPRCLGKKPNTAYEWKAMKLYNSRDCLISKKFIEYFQQCLNLLGSELRPTISGCALNLFQRRFLKKPIYHEPKNINKYIFQSYYGGRVEAFKRGQIKDYYYYDFNSLYPSQMIKEYPKPESMKEPYNNTVYNINKYHGISDVLIETPINTYYPFLPYRAKDKKLLFPIGKFRGVYTHIELRKALTLGYKIHKIYKQFIYTKTFYPFKKYVHTLYALRNKYKLEENHIMQQTCKLLLNSLYGKFATHYIEEIIFTNNNKKFTISTLDYTTTQKECESTYVIPILSSYTSAYARIKLYDTITKYNAIYCDTDSIVTQEEIPTSNEIGELKLEYYIKRGIIIKPKAYAFNDYVKLKGIKNPIMADFEAILNNKPISKIKFVKLKESIKRRFNTNEIISIIKNIDLEDNKRLWKNKFNKYYLQNSMPRIIYDTHKHGKAVINDSF